MKEPLAFVVYGDWVTDTARKMYWADRITLDECLHFLLQLMRGREEAETRMYAIKLLLGKVKLEGNTADGSYGLVEDNDFDTYEKMRNFVTNSYAPVYDVKKAYRFLEDSLCGAECQDKRKDRIEDEYGWLSPAGDFYPSEFGSHESSAYELAVEHQKLVDMSAIEQSQEQDIFKWASLTLLRSGWILLHNPHFGTAIVQIDETKRPTKPQREFLYDYYILRNCKSQAKQWLDDGL